MEGKSVKPIALVLIVLMGMFVGQSSASFKSCYQQCFLLCVASGQKAGHIIGCPFKCLKECLFKGASSNDLHNYCQLGCASSTCTNISTPQDPREEEVESCVGSCSDNCIKKY